MTLGNITLLITPVALFVAEVQPSNLWNEDNDPTNKYRTINMGVYWGGGGHERENASKVLIGFQKPRKFPEKGGAIYRKVFAQELKKGRSKGNKETQPRSSNEH